MAERSDADGFTRLSELNLERQRVFVRADLDCQLTTSGELDDAKLHALQPTLRRLLDSEAQVVVAGHRGDPRTASTVGSLEPCAARLAELLNAEVYLPDENVGLLARKLVNELRPGRLVVLENLLLDPREADGDPTLARELAEGVELYVAECLAGPHSYASVARMPKFVRERVIGLHFERELVAANRLRHARSKAVVVLGGSFAAGQRLLPFLARTRATVCTAGPLARTLQRARDGASGANDRDKTELAEARTWLARAQNDGVTVLLPEDAVVREEDGVACRPFDATASDTVLDLGEATVRDYAARVANANASLIAGTFSEPKDSPPLTDGARTILKRAAEASVFSVALHQPDFAVRMLEEATRARLGFISTAGSAFLQLLCEEKLAGVEALRRVQ